MSEESILILNMLREGKINAEQADSLLRAVRTTGMPAPPAPPPAPPPPLPPTDTATLAAMQAKLAELQSKLGDVQGKVGAAQAARAAGQAVSLAGKVLGNLPHPDVDMGKIGKAMEDAMRGFSSLKNDAVRNAKVAARQAAHEAKKAAREGGKTFGDMGFVFTFNSDDDSSKRPNNADNKPNATETMDSVVTWSGADRLKLHNPHGALHIVGEDRTDNAASASITKQAWADTSDAARVLLQQVFLVTTTEGDTCKVSVVAPADAKRNLLVNVTIRVPRGIALSAETTFGAIDLDAVNSHAKAQTTSGDILVHHPHDAGTGEARLETHSGTLTADNFNAPATALALETSSGNVQCESVSVQSVHVSTRSGDVLAQKVQSVAAAHLESVSGDVRVLNSGFGTRATLKTQSGDVFTNTVQCDSLHMETVSGDATVHNTTATLTVKTISGDVNGERNNSASSLSAVSGDVEWNVPAAFDGVLAATTVSGDIDIKLPADASVRVEQSTASGDLHCDVPLADGAIVTARHIAGTCGGGVGSVKLQTASGDARIAPV